MNPKIIREKRPKRRPLFRHHIKYTIQLGTRTVEKSTTIDSRKSVTKRSSCQMMLGRAINGAKLVSFEVTPIIYSE